MSPLRFAQLETALGPMLAAWTDLGLAAIHRGTDLPAFVSALGRRFRDLPMEPGAPPADLERQLDEFLAGSRRSFDVTLDPTGVSPFDVRVYDAARAVPYGETATYGELAARVGAPGAARAVGGAMSRCPFSPIVPCHRIVRASDGFSGWGGDLSVKRWLLDLERGDYYRASQGAPRGPRAPHESRAAVVRSGNRRSRAL
jgi:O-6-methylguanine DNA methyltransferase